MSITLGLVLLLGLSYAWFTLTLNGTKQNVIKVGNLSLILDESMGEGIHLDPAIPMTFDMGLQQEPYHFEVENNGTVDANYKLKLNLTGETYDIYFALKRDGKIVSIKDGNLVDSDSLLLEQGVISKHGRRKYDLYIWINSSAIQDSVGDLVSATVTLDADQQKEIKLSNLVMHACDGIADCDRVDQNFTYFQEGYYKKEPTMKYVWYSGKLWIVTGYDSEGNVKMVTTEPATMLSWGTNSDYQGSYVEQWLNEEFLPNLNHYENLLVTDQIWNYSRSVGSYADPIGNDKLVTSPVGLLNSWDIHQGWLDDTLEHSHLIMHRLASSYLGNASSTGMIFLGGTAGYSLISIEPSKVFSLTPSVVLKKNVEVISGSGTSGDPYLLKGDDFGKPNDLLNTRYAGEYIAFGDNVNYSYCISGVENGLTKIVSSLPILQVLEDEEGETIQFFNKGTKDPISKKIVYPYPYLKDSTIDKNKYIASSQDYPIAYFLNHDFLNPLNGYLTNSDVSMIEPNQNWYPGTVLGGENYNKLRTESNANIATVGLLSLGEAQNVAMKVDLSHVYSQISDSNSQITKNLLLNNNGTDFYSYNTSTSDGATEAATYRPSMYLKSNVKIKSGSGTREDPYILTL